MPNQFLSVNKDTQILHTGTFKYDVMYVYNWENSFFCATHLLVFTQHFKQTFQGLCGDKTHFIRIRDCVHKFERPLSKLVLRAQNAA